MELAFWKMHGIGNDYIIVNCLKKDVKEPEKTARILSNRHKGIGSDGLILVYPSPVADFKMVMYNADGSRGRMCGNGIRLLGKYVYENRLTRNRVLLIETDSGIRRLHLHVKNHKVETVTVHMGSPAFGAEHIPIQTEDDVWLLKSIQIGSTQLEVTCVSMGNPHTVIFNHGTREKEFSHWAPALAESAYFPEGTNVELVTVKDEVHLDVRVWERGSGETLACGTGACAAVVCAVKIGLCKQGVPVEVKLPGGILKICYEPENTVLMEGPATYVFAGKVVV
jgi:diaminopimelate epimerase